MGRRIVRTLTGKELRYAAAHKVAVHYEEKYRNPQDRHMNFKGTCVMQEARQGFYIGNSDIDPDEFKDGQLVEGDFPEGTFKVCALPGKIYEPHGKKS